LSNSSLIRLVLFSLCTEAIPQSLVSYLIVLLLVPSAGPATFRDGGSPLNSAHNDIPYVGADWHRSATQLLTRTFGEISALFCSYACNSLCFVSRNPPATQHTPLRQESFACVTFPKQALVLFPQLIPQVMKFLIVRTEHNMAQLMKHGVDHLFHWQKLLHVSCISKSEQYLLASIDIQT
jgi:hypothetical protein